MVNMKNYYNTILAQAFSPCGKFLFAGDYYGTISVFNLHKILTTTSSTTTNDTTLPITPLATYPLLNANNGTSSTIHSMVSTPNYLLVGTAGVIHGLAWPRSSNSFNTNRKDWQPQWRIEVPGGVTPPERVDRKGTFASADETGSVEINAMVWDESSGCVYVAGGDGVIYIVDVEQGKVTRAVGAHNGSVYCLYKFKQDVVSSSEDGVVLGWDMQRSKASTFRLEPHKVAGVGRPALGKWVGAVARNEDWLVCGGGPRLALWHVRTMNRSAIYDGIKDEGIHVLTFHEDKVVAGGRSRFVYQLRINGSVVSEVETSGGAVYSVEMQEEGGNGRPKVMVIAGSSPNIDVCTNFNYKDLTLTTL